MHCSLENTRSAGTLHSFIQTSEFLEWINIKRAIDIVVDLQKKNGIFYYFEL